MNFDIAHILGLVCMNTTHTYKPFFKAITNSFEGYCASIPLTSNFIACGTHMLNTCRLKESTLKSYWQFTLLQSADRQ